MIFSSSASAVPVKESDLKDVQKQIEAHAPWYHQIDLGNGVYTIEKTGDDFGYPHKLWESIQSLLPKKLAGQTILDVGCSDGFFSIESVRMGAKHVLAIDTEKRRIRNLTFLKEYLELDALQVQRESLYKLHGVGEFDVGFLLGFLHCTEHPLLALQQMNTLCNTIIIGSLIAPGAKHPYLLWGPWVKGQKKGWVPTTSCLEEMIEFAGFSITNTIHEPYTEHTIFECKRTKIIENPIYS